MQKAMGSVAPVVAMAAIGLAAAAFPTRAREPQPVTEAQVRTALATYEKDPLSEAGMEAAGVVMRFAEEDQRVRVVFFEEAAPWMVQDESGNPTSELMAAFVVGNVKAQMAAGRPGTNSYAGTLEVFRVYALLKKSHESLNIPSIEKFLNMEKAGKLRAYLDEVDAKHGREDHSPAPSGEPALPEA